MNFIGFTGVRCEMKETTNNFKRKGFTQMFFGVWYVQVLHLKTQIKDSILEVRR